MLAVVGTRGSADIVQPALELGSVALSDCQAELKCRVGFSCATVRETVGDAVAELVDAVVEARGLSQSERKERSEEETASDNHRKSRKLES